MQAELKRYRVAVGVRQKVEQQVSELSQTLRSAESDLRKAREEERRALALFENAVEAAGE